MNYFSVTHNCLLINKEYNIYRNFLYSFYLCGCQDYSSKFFSLQLEKERKSVRVLQTLQKLQLLLLQLELLQIASICMKTLRNLSQDPSLLLVHSEVIRNRRFVISGKLLLRLQWRLMD